MFNDAHVSLTGYIATQPVMREIAPGTSNLTMRVAWTARRIDRATGNWVDGNTSFVTVICWRKLADNAATCLRKGDPVLVKGRLSVRDFEDKAGAPRTAVEVEASSVGHDISRGVAQFQRVRPRTGMTASEFALAGPGGEAAAVDGQPAAAGLGDRSAVTSGEAFQDADVAGDELADEMFDEAAVAGLADSAEPVPAPS